MTWIPKWKTSTGTDLLLILARTLQVTYRSYLERKRSERMAMVDTAALQEAVNALYPYNYVESQSNDDDESPSIYKLSDDAAPPTWTAGLSSRFESTVQQGILYRPQIVGDLRGQIDRLFQKPLIAVGLMVKGPQGVGKSHTLVNLVENLEDRRRRGCSPYHVTFIPDCDKWLSVEYFIETMFASFNVSAAEVGFDFARVKTSFNVLELVAILDGMLRVKNVKWIFIFDQVNALFGRTEYEQLKDVHKLPFPYQLISNVRKPQRILSIICASANNEISHRDGHTGFHDYMHPIKLNEEEISTMYATRFANMKELEKTGFIPLQVARFVELGEDYEVEERDSITESVMKLSEQLRKSPERWDDFKRGVVLTLLKAETTAIVFDRKYFIDNRTSRGHKYEPLYPFVEEVYMSFFWDQIMRYVRENEGSLLAVCGNPSDQGSRGRHFELIVVQRCQRAQFTIPGDQDGEYVTIPHDFRRFPGKLLPDDYSPHANDGVIVPNDPSFKAIDMVWKIGKRVIGVQVHISAHKDTVTAFEGLCRAAGWHTSFETIEMWYLGPTVRARALVAGFVGKHRCRATRGSDFEWTIDVSAKTIGDISCLSDIRWPAGVS